MISYKKYKKLYYNTSFLGYLDYILFQLLKKLLKVPYHCYMCLRYPFLYPRNRFTGLHYNNWKLKNIIKDIHERYCRTDINTVLPKEKVYYVEKHSKVITYWHTFWAKPLWKILNFWHDKVLQVLFCIPTWNEWEAVETGWNKAFGKQYLEELRTQLIKDKMLYTFRIMQIKEKWGELQLYCCFASQKVYDIIRKYEDLSWETCINCGKPADVQTTGWVLPMCRECAEKSGRKYISKNEQNEL